MINHLGGLYRELHHVKIAGDSDGDYEPTLVILSHSKKGRSFMIPIGAMWKYVDPLSYFYDENARLSDQRDFEDIWNKNLVIASGKNHLIYCRAHETNRAEAVRNLSACQFALAFHRGSRVMLCTSYNLAKCMQMFDILPTPQAAAQLLLWIQSRLDDLKNMPDKPEKDQEFVGGEATMFVGGEKVATKDMIVTETDLVIHDNV